MRPRVTARKHYVQISLAAVASGAITNLTIADARQDPDRTVPNEIREGAVVTAVYCEMWIQSDDATAGSSIITLVKIPGSGASANMTTTESALLNDYDNKKNVFHTQMGLTPNNTQFPMATIKGWFKIPKGKQRFGLLDRLMLNVHGQSNGLTLCGFFIYKEQL